MTVAYWIAVLVGALIVFWIIKFTSKHADVNEGFNTAAAPPAPPPAAAAAQNALNNDYTETLALPGFPKQPDTALCVYLSSFSDRVAYTEGTVAALVKPLVYDGQVGLWRDIKSADYSFRLNVVDAAKGVIPATLKTRNAAGVPIDIGLSLQSLRLVGPSSRTLGDRIGSTAAYALTSFTAAFFGIIEDVDFKDAESRKVLFRITAENPDRVEIAVRRRDNKNVLLEVILGDAGKAYQWVVDKFMLMSNRLPTLYALTYDKGSKTTPIRVPSITFYIGKTKLQKLFTHANAPADVRLGNSEVSISPEGMFNMKLVSFSYFKTPLEDKALDDLGKYFTQQQSGIDVLISKKDEEHNAITTELQKKLAAANRTLDDAEDELQKCKKAAEEVLATSPKINKHWQVSLDTPGATQAAAKLTADDIKKCAPLALASSVVATATAAATKAKKNNKPPASLSDPTASIQERLRDLAKK